MLRVAVDETHLQHESYKDTVNALLWRSFFVRSPLLISLWRSYRVLFWSHCEDFTVCIIGENNGRTSANSVLANVWAKFCSYFSFGSWWYAPPRLFLNFKFWQLMDHLKDFCQRLQMHRDVQSLVERADDISKHCPSKRLSLTQYDRVPKMWSKDNRLACNGT